MNGGRQSSALLCPLLVVWVVHLIKKSTRAVSRTSCHITNTSSEFPAAGRAPTRSSALALGSNRRSVEGAARRGWFSPPQLSTDVACCGGLLLFLFSLPVAGCRPCLASSLHSPLRAERGSGARGATSDARETRAARVHAGGFRRRSRAGAFARCGGLLFLSSRPVCHSARAAPSLHPRAGGAHATPRAGARTHATRAAPWESRRGALSQCAARVRSVLRCSLLPAPRAPLPRSATRLGGGSTTAIGRAAHATCDARHARRAGSPRVFRFPLS